MGTSFILLFHNFPFFADLGGSTTIQIGRGEGVNGGNLLSNKLTAHVVAFCTVPALVSLFCIHALPSLFFRISASV